MHYFVSVPDIPFCAELMSYALASSKKKIWGKPEAHWRCCYPCPAPSRT